MIELGLFAQMETNLRSNLNLSVGLRWDATISGYYQIITTNLYNVIGFDQATKSYNYSVNTNAGTRSKTASYYAVQFGLRYSF